MKPLAMVRKRRKERDICFNINKRHFDETFDVVETSMRGDLYRYIDKHGCLY